MPSTRPRLIDSRYELGDVIGAGGMGEVRTAHDLRLDREVAIKLLHTTLIERPGMRERIRSEARAAARLAHPHAVAVFDAGIDGDQPYIVMERLQGRTLEDELGQGSMPIDRIRTMGLQVLQALEAAHAIGLIHRDVKPGNVLAAGRDRWKVADFGIAKWLDESGITRTGDVMGSPAYLAPERLDGAPASPASDLYSVGVMLYEALAGRRPAEGEHMWAVAVAVREGAVPPLSELRHEISAEVERVVATAMSADPNDRFPTARHMGDALRRAAQSTMPLPVPTDQAATTAVVRPTREHVTQEIPNPDAARELPPAPRPTSDRATTRRLGRADRSTPRRLVVTVVLGAVVSALLVAAVVLALSESPPRQVASGSTGPTSELPATLSEALDRLEEAVP